MHDIDPQQFLPGANRQQQMVLVCFRGHCNIQGESFLLFVVMEVLQKHSAVQVVKEIQLKAFMESRFRKELRNENAGRCGASDLRAYLKNDKSSSFHVNV